MTSSGRVGVFGGTFDPVHIGHLIVAEVLRVKLRLDRILFLPAGRPPHKPNQVLSADEDRIAMLELALADAPNYAISRLDIDRVGPSFTADSIDLLRGNLNLLDELYFLMGEDSLRDFPSWHEPHRIVTKARLGVALRPGVDIAVDDVHAAVPEARGRIDIVNVPLIGVSSREIRDEVGRGGAYRYQVLPAVARYIEGQGLYRERAAGGNRS